MSVRPIDIKTNLLVTEDASRLREAQKAHEAGQAEQVAQNRNAANQKTETVQKTEAGEGAVRPLSRARPPRRPSRSHRRGH